MNKLRVIGVFSLVMVLAFGITGSIYAGPPPMPSSFWGEIHLTDNPPSAGQQILATVPGVAGNAGSATLILYNGNLAYSMDVRGDDLDTSSVKEGGIENDLITFLIGGRVVMTGRWHGGTNVRLNVHPPDAALTASAPAYEGSAVALDASGSTDWGGDIGTYAFDCDGNGAYEIGPLAGATASCTFADNGTYAVGVKVVDAQGGEGLATATATVLNTVPVVNAGDDQIADEGGVVTFGGSFTDAGTADTHTMAWDFGDGGTAAGTLTPNHIYADNGEYIVTLMVTDDDGASASDTLRVTVSNLAPVVNAGDDQTANEGRVVTFGGSFTDAGTADTHTMAWDFGDGSTAAGTLAPNHIYADNGEYIVTLTVTDDDGASASDTLRVTVSNLAPTAEAGGPYTCIAGTNVTFSGSATDPSSVDITAGFSYAWLVDDTLALSGPTPALANCGGLGAGTYTVLVTVTDKDGGVDTDTASLTVEYVTHSVALYPGWNLVSFNLHPTDTAIASVLASVAGSYDLVYVWDAPSQNWRKYDNIPDSPDTLSTLDEKAGFWIHITAASTVTLNVTGSLPTTTNITLYSNGQGWNLVGYPAAVDRPLPVALASVDFSLVYAYHANDPDLWKLFDIYALSWANDLTALSPGWGYWVKVSANGTWTVNYP